MRTPILPVLLALLVGGGRRRLGRLAPAAADARERLEAYVRFLAEDNASGTAVVIEMARRFAARPDAGASSSS